MSAPALTDLVEVTALHPTTGRDDVAALLDAAISGDCATVCLPPTLLPLRGVPEHLRVVSVAGYPSGKHHPLVKGSEARMAVAYGAHEVHVVLDAANLVAGDAGDVNAVLSEIVTLRESVPAPAVLQVGPGDLDLSDARIETFCRAAVTAGADVVVGASVDQAIRMADSLGDARVPVKAAVVDTAPEAQRAVSAGVRRLGVPVAVLEDVLGAE